MLKKILIAISCILLFGLVWALNNDYVLTSFNGKRTVYLSSYSSNCRIENTNLNKCFYLSSTGESVEIDSEIPYTEIFDFYNAKTVFIEDHFGGESYYGYSSKIKYSVKLNGKRVNIHVVKKSGKTVIGIPLIYGSF